MKIQLLAFGLILAASSGTGFAQSAGIYGFGIELDGTGAGATNSGTTTLYALDDNGGNDLLPAGSSATLDTSGWSGSTGTSPTFNLGTFTQGLGTLTLTGGSMDTYSDQGSTVSSATLLYSIAATNANGGPYTSLNLPHTANLTTNGDGSGHNQIWDTESQSINLLSNLTPGTYQIAVYGDSANSVNGTSYDSNNSNNFGAVFTVVAAPAVPEPSTWEMMLGGLGMLVCFQVIRRKSAV